MVIKKAKLRKGRSRRGNREIIGARFAADRASADDGKRFDALDVYVYKKAKLKGRRCRRKPGRGWSSIGHGAFIKMADGARADL